MADPRPPTREELAQFLPNQRNIRAFEELFNAVPADLITLQNLIQDAIISAGTAGADAVSALSQIILLNSQITSLRSAIQEGSIDANTAISKAVDALAQVISVEKLVNNAVQKVPSTDNAVARFDGAGGDLKDSSNFRYDDQTVIITKSSPAQTANILSVEDDTSTEVASIDVDGVGTFRGTTISSLNGVSGTINIGSINTTNTGTNNQVYGPGSGISISTGINNIAQGSNAARFNASGSNWVAQGANAGFNSLTGNSWIAQGTSAGRENTTGSNWIAQGNSAGRENVSGNSWIAQGASAGRNNTTGNSWIAQGINAGLSNISGSNWIAQGTSAGRNNTTGGSWVAQGTNAGLNNISGNNWIAQGVSAGLSSTTGSSWVAQGSSAGRNNTTGGSWVAIGVSAGRYINSGADLTIANNTIHLGGDTRSLADNASNEIVIGDAARGNGSNTVTIGNSSITGNYFNGILDTNGDTLRIRNSRTPANASDTGNQGDIAWDNDYIYVCVATDTWKRTTISTW